MWDDRLMTDIAPHDLREARLTRPDGRIVAWTESGVLDGRPLLRIPGTPGSRHAVRVDQAAWIERRLRVVTTERPGFGASTRLPGRGFLEPADDVAAILDELRIERLPVYAGSGGAPHLLALAARHPDRVAAATIVVGAAPNIDEEADQMIGLNAEGYRLARQGDRDGMTALLEPVREALLADPMASFRETMATAPRADQEIMGDPVWQQSLVRGIRESLRLGVEGWVDESMLMFSGWADLDLSQVRASLTWWHGDRDRNAPLSAVQRLLARVPHARLIVWQHAGHLTAYLKEPEILDELLGRA
jgi:pimeloyl-ACP methyl ester carboxylesterase